MAKINFYYDKNPLQFLLSSKLNVVLNFEDSFIINAKEVTIKEVPAGSVKIQMSAPYFGSEIGKAREDFVVNENDIVHVTYRSPYLVFSSGTIFVEKGEKRNKKATNILGSYFKMAAFFLVFALILGIIFSLISSSIANNYINTNQNQNQSLNENKTPQNNEQEESSFTVNQENAIRKASTYLQVMAFSRSGLIKQLEYEGFATDDAIVGVDNVGAEWLTQAKLKATYYLKTMAFSRSGLIKQLEYEGFSTDEATAGVDNMGADWFIQAELKAAQYLKVMAFSKSALLQQLEYEGFTKEEAEHGVKSTGLK